MLKIITEYKKNTLSLREKKKILKTCLAPKSVEKTLKAEERNNTLHKWGYSLWLS